MIRLSLIAALLGLLSAQSATAQEAAGEDLVTPEVFMEAMATCLTWLRAEEGEANAFAEWEEVAVAIDALPDHATTYALPGTDFVVGLAADAASKVCVGRGGGLILADMGSSVESWLEAEIETGRLAMATWATGFEHSLAICDGPPGGGDIMRDEANHLMFIFETGDAVIPPEGVC